VIVTNATLFMGTFDAAAVSLTSGRVPDDTTFTEVPYIRFSKTLWSSQTSDRTAGLSTLQDIHDRRKRTVWVVSGAHLMVFLEHAQPSSTWPPPEGA